MLSLSTNGGDNLSVSSSSQSHSQLQVNKYDSSVFPQYYRLFRLGVMHAFVNSSKMQLKLFIRFPTFFQNTTGETKDVQNTEIFCTISHYIWFN